jgi:methylated-DNA-[protein]-cysteine S-methyltransferase
MQALLAGEADDLKDVALDFEDAEDFQRRVWEMIRDIPPGETRTYGDLARALGDVGLSRAVGQALGQNPCPIIAPCHRILGADGKTGGFSGGAGVETKMRLLSIEKAKVGGEPSLFDDLPLAARPRRA